MPKRPTVTLPPSSKQSKSISAGVLTSKMKGSKEMNKNLNDAIFEIEKAESIMYAIEKCYLDLDVVEEERELRNRGCAAFYAAWDCIRRTKEALDKLSGDCLVVDAILAVSEAHDKKEK